MSKKEASLEEQFEKVGLNEELIGITAMNPFCNYNSSSRSIMMASHMSQTTTLLHGDEKIIQSGLEKEFAQQTFSKKLDNDSRVISIIPRYRSGVDIDAVEHIVDAILIYEDLTTNEISYIDLPYSSDLHNYFGFKYKWNHDILDNLKHNDTLEAGTILASSPAVTENNGYKYGANINVCLMSMNETSEDAVILSESATKKLGIEIFEKRTIEFGADSFLLNMYGDDENYKPIPDIGESIHPSGAVAAVRDIDDELAPSLTSYKDIQEFNPIFDKVTYVRAGECEVVDIKVLNTPKNKKNVYTHTDEMLKKYTKAYNRYMKDILDTYNEINKDFKNKYRDQELKVSPKFTRLLVNAMAVTDSNDPGSDRFVKKLYKNENMDIYSIQIKIRYKMAATEGYKISDSSGNKAIVCEVRKDEDMPKDINGISAEMIQAPDSTISRMNIGRLYEMYIARASREVKMKISNDIIAINDVDNLSSTIDTLSSDMVDSLFNTVLRFLKIIGTKQYVKYKSLTDMTSKCLILKEIVNEELYIYYSVSSERKAYDIVEDLRASEFAPLIGKLTFKDKDGNHVETEEDIMIAPLYTIVLAKISDTWLSTASSKVNHFGLPTSTSKADKHRLPWRNNCTKVLSETEARLYASYVGQKFVAEIKERGNSIPAHEATYENILNAEQPTNMDHVIDRTKVPYGQDKSKEAIDSLLNCAGIELAYEE